MLPTPSCLSVSTWPEVRLRHRCSSRYLQISPLHLEFQLPLLYSSTPVSNASPRLSRGISHQTWHAACAPFTPNDSEQRSPPTCYRGCWHVVSRGLFPGSRHRAAIPCGTYSPPGKELYNLTAFVVHAASLRQTFVHCGRFLAAASRRSLGRVSVPMWPVALSGRLSIVALVGRYPANKLMDRGLIPRRRLGAFPRMRLRAPGSIRYYPVFPRAIPGRGADYPRVTHPSATLGGRSPLPCDLHA